VIDPKSIIQDSEYIETHLVAVPNQLVKDFQKTYETVAPMVVPRSAQLVAQDSEFTLYAVTSFKKHSAEFVHKCREQKWIPRDFKYVEGGKEEERKEVERVGGDERKLWGETLRLGRTAWSEAVMVWIHILVLRVFVETVLRYGLPLDFICALVRVCICCVLWFLFGGRQLLTAIFYRRHPLSRLIVPSPTLRTNTHIWLGMPLGAIRKVVCSAMILVRCMLVVREVRTTRRMCFTNSSSTECCYWRDVAVKDTKLWTLRTYTIWVHRAQTSIWIFCLVLNTMITLKQDNQVSSNQKVYIVQYVQEAVRGNQDEKKKQNPNQIRCTRQLLSEKSI
jgi:hypothetical protein